MTIMVKVYIYQYGNEVRSLLEAIVELELWKRENAT